MNIGTLRAVLARVEDLLGLVVVGVEVDLRLRGRRVLSPVATS